MEFDQLKHFNEEKEIKGTVGFGLVLVQMLIFEK